MIDVHAMREEDQRVDIDDVGWIKSEFKPDDATKIKKNEILS